MLATIPLQSRLRESQQILRSFFNKINRNFHNCFRARELEARIQSSKVNWPACELHAHHVSRWHFPAISPDYFDMDF
jgi:hypothetical protein